MKQRLDEIDRVIARGPYSADWASLSNFRPPEWYRDAKFGIFIHWGVYSVPAYDCEWYPRNMYMQGSKAFEHHVQTYGPHREFGYKDLVPLFRAEKFDPDAWAALFERAGARYVILTALKTTHARKVSCFRRIDQIAAIHPNASEQISHALCSRSGV